jgi:hypothetical protein
MKLLRDKNLTLTETFSTLFLKLGMCSITRTPGLDLATGGVSVESYDG